MNHKPTQIQEEGTYTLLVMRRMSRSHFRGACGIGDIIGAILENIICYTRLVIKNRMCEVTEFKVKYRGHQALFRNKVRRQKLQNVYILELTRAKESRKTGNLIKSG